MRTVQGSTSPVNCRALLLTFVSLLMLIAFQVAVADYADAKKRKRYRANPKYAAIVIDAKTGKVLHSRNANSRRYPASLTKMMTLYLMFEEMKAGRLKKSTRIRFSRNAAAEQPSKLGVRAGRSVTAQQAILALVTKSANDVATAVAEHIGGSEAAFAKRMTRKARQLGMNRTTFRNAHGLPNRNQVTTAADMAKLGLALREHFPRRYRYFQTRSFKYGRRRMRNHNRLLGRIRGVDGIKTGYTRASGFNLVSSVSSRKRRIVAVVMGGRSGRSRNAQMAKLIKRYLPKASRRGARRLIAKARPSWTGGKTVVQTASVATEPKKSVGKVSRVSAAHAVAVPPAKDVEKVRDFLLSMAPTETPRPDLRNEAVAKVDEVVTASVSSKPRPNVEIPLAKPNSDLTAAAVRADGWQIQIAATDSRESALQLLDKVQTKNKRLLRKTDPRAYRVEIGENTFYRARFTGFASKTAARRACRIIKRQRTACLALNG